MTTATPSTRQRRAARTRQAIIDAARELITERGAQNLSLREIARRIEYSPAGLYEYFANKDEIVQAVIMDGFRRFGNYMYSVSTDLPADEYLRDLGINYVRFARQNPEHFLLIFSRPELQVFQTSESIDDTSDAQGTFQTLISGINRMIAEGFLPPSTNVMEAAFGNWSIVHGIAMLIVTQMQHLDIDWDAKTAQVLADFSKGLAINEWARHNA